MAADMWWRIWIRIDGEYVVVVYGNIDDDDAVVIYGSGGSIWIRIRSGGG